MVGDCRRRLNESASVVPANSHIAYSRLLFVIRTITQLAYDSLNNSYIVIVDLASSYTLWHCTVYGQSGDRPHTCLHKLRHSDRQKEN